MKKQQIAKRMARQSGVSRGEAADRLDGVVQRLLWDLRRGKEAALPGFGRFVQGPDGMVSFERDGAGPVD